MAVFFRQFYDTPLAQASYMIGCQATGEALVIDPVRDVEAYVRTAEQEGLRIVLATETHIHADFVSGCRELSARTGARVLLSAEGGDRWQYDYAAADNAGLLRDGDAFDVGNIRVDVLHTPGHTPEHLAFVVTDTPAAAGPMGVITGDFVFVGDVGRPDLLERTAQGNASMHESARTLFQSLQKFRALPDHLQLWPGHGAGSACGKALGAVPFSTVGYEKLANWALAVHDEAAFVERVLDGQPDPPAYFATMKRVNKTGPRVLRGLVMPSRLPGASVHEVIASTAVLLDLRPAATFAAAHVPNSLSLPYNRNFSTWAGSLIPSDSEIVLLLNADPDDHTPRELSHAVHDLALIGFDQVSGWMDQDALRAFTNGGGTLGQVPQLTAHDVAAARDASTITVIDVRRPSEWAEGHIPGAENVPLGDLASAIDSLPTTPLVVQCQTGTRSAIAASVLLRAGRRDVSNFAGGMSSWANNALPVERG